MAVTITFDLEDNRRSGAQEARFIAMTERFLEFAESRGVTLTVFVVGEIARDHPGLISRVADRGHEIGLHGMRHVALGAVGSGRLYAELSQGREMLEQVAQAPVSGFRAPIFSLTPATAWAVDEITRAGFAYSSSVLPATNPLHGWPGAPRTPFRWEGGLLEFPCPVGGPGRAAIPYLGGIYLRYVPLLAMRSLLAASGDRTGLWSYVHPYDLDPDEPFFVLPHAGWLTSRIVHTRRAATLPRLDSLIAAAGGPGRPLGDVASELASRSLPSMRPV